VRPASKLLDINSNRVNLIDASAVIKTDEFAWRNQWSMQ